ncbi:hypothetical protein VPNG_06433 [Cytospora leucostoma]|uniref:Uncharacterized protein n=1 Tax=Cytospora leucostoma TaxID=1230097 RepID=A0A423WZ23_9PEZI|nr:hypothetical protein VPNG_06433 [Cytospora leucostoma]
MSYNHDFFQPSNKSVRLSPKIQAVLQRSPKKAVQTTLDTAVYAIIELESREALATAGSPSDPTVETDYPRTYLPEAYHQSFEE